MIIAFSGQEIDDKKFPLSLRWVVMVRIQAVFEKLEVKTVVCCGANGADLLALEVAENMGIERFVVLPTDVEDFKEKYVVTKPGCWGDVFDKAMRLVPDGNVVTRDFASLEEAYAICLKVAEERSNGKPVGVVSAAKDLSTSQRPGEKALLILREGAVDVTPKQAKAMYAELEITKDFGYARRIFALVAASDTISPEDRIKMQQKNALCTYKDAELPVGFRLDEALKILGQVGLSSETKNNQETLSLKGAVYKRKWEADGQIKNLEQAFTYYNQAYALGPKTDDGYSGVNAAYVLDLLAQNESNFDAGIKQKYEEMATGMRNTLVEVLKDVPANAGTEQKYWIFVTIAEAYFGLGKYEDAREWLKKAVTVGNIPDWRLESTTRQLAQIALLRSGNKLDEIRSSSAWDVLSVLTGDDRDESGALKTAFIGKAGLALSGGGFRAAFYHIGVLARLAELDELRNIEVLSCVSGGSIIGAHYYLELKALLEREVDSKIEKQHYIDIVAKTSKDFLKGVQRNLRMRVISNWGDNFRLFWDAKYSRSLRLGDLYERDIFLRATNVKKDKKGRIWLNELKIAPLIREGQQSYQQTWFNPKYDNWRRRAKVPILILNATTLNTGHNWQFSATWMGESPFTVQAIDGNDRLRRVYYNYGPGVEPPLLREMRLGRAVAASSAVPGMFDPLKLDNLYEGDYKVRLVDGGVHDNQGVASLLEQDCTVMMVSDASGQMTSVKSIPDNILAVPIRANNILMERVRNAEYQDLATRRVTRLLKGFMFIHLKMELPVNTVDWVECDDPQPPAGAGSSATVASYGIRKDLQLLLSNIRTDLDSFNDTEAFALMTSGYQMTYHEYDRTIHRFTKGHVGTTDWCFLKILPELQQVNTPHKTIQLLTVAGSMVFKIWMLSKGLKIAKWVLAGLGAIGVVVLFVYFWKHCFDIKVSTIGISLIIFLAGLFINKYIIDVVRWRDTLMKIVQILALTTVLWVVVWVHLIFFDREYLKLGKRRKDACAGA